MNPTTVFLSVERCAFGGVLGVIGQVYWGADFIINVIYRLNVMAHGGAFRGIMSPLILHPMLPSQHIPPSMRTILQLVAGVIVLIILSFFLHKTHLGNEKRKPRRARIVIRT